MTHWCAYQGISQMEPSREGGKERKKGKNEQKRQEGLRPLSSCLTALRFPRLVPSRLRCCALCTFPFFCRSLLCVLRLRQLRQISLFFSFLSLPIALSLSLTLSLSLSLSLTFSLSLSHTHIYLSSSRRPSSVAPSTTLCQRHASSRTRPGQATFWKLAPRLWDRKAHLFCATQPRLFIDFDDFDDYTTLNDSQRLSTFLPVFVNRPTSFASFNKTKKTKKDKLSGRISVLRHACVF